MRISNLLPVNATPSIIRAKTGFNGGIPFNVSFSARARGKASIEQVERYLEKVASRIAQSPYQRYFKGKSVNITLVTNEDMKDLGCYYQQGKTDDYSMPESKIVRYFSGAYNPVENTIAINAEAFLLEGEFETLFHEFLHANSSEISKTSEDTLLVKSGVSCTEIKLIGDKEETISQEGRFLNEGITEFIRIRMGGTIHANHLYFPLYQCISILAQRIGEELIVDAYFNGKLDKLKEAVERAYGPSGYKELLGLASLCNSVGDERDENNLLGFIRFGFEYFAMVDWGYSAENRTLAPRPLFPSDLPEHFRDLIEELGITIFTNLTADDLVRFFNNITLPEKHIKLYFSDNSSYQSYLGLRDLVHSRVESEQKEGKHIMVAIKYNSALPIDHSNAYLEFYPFKSEYLRLPRFWERAEWRGKLCAISIKQA